MSRKRWRGRFATIFLVPFCFTPVRLARMPICREMGADVVPPVGSDVVHGCPPGGLFADPIAEY
jgi:hypothetical protein